MNINIEQVTSWFTPTILFILTNLMIGTIIIRSSILKPSHQNHKTTQNDDVNNPHPQLLRLPSLFERVKSINLSRYPRPDNPEPTYYPEPNAQQHEPEPDMHHVTRTKSETVTKAVRVSKVLKKSLSEKVVAKDQVVITEEHQRPKTVREKTGAFNGDDEEVDEKADDFINRFRQQLKLQRLDSILRYKEMLNRGMGR